MKKKDLQDNNIHPLQDGGKNAVTIHIYWAEAISPLLCDHRDTESE